VSSRVAVGIATLAVLVSGCVAKTQMYDWGNYDPSLYAYYKDPGKVTDLAESLASIISTADASKAPVPPGIYAEYGYIQLEQGKNQQAIELFKREEARWPESKVFMDRMISVASIPAAAPTTQSLAK
jgi:hypothetical protein